MLIQTDNWVLRKQREIAILDGNMTKKTEMLVILCCGRSVIYIYSHLHAFKTPYSC
jgi:hypothetical protein